MSRIPEISAITPDIEDVRHLDGEDAVAAGKQRRQTEDAGTPASDNSDAAKSEKIKRDTIDLA